MLKFESWPPEAGKVHFSEGATQAFSNAKTALQEFPQRTNPLSAIEDLAFACGSIVRANTSTSAAQNIGSELAESIEDEIIKKTFTFIYEKAIQYESEATQGVTA